MASPSPQHDFLDPTEDGQGDALGMLGHYKVVRELGKGGMGFVFLGEDTRLQRQVALKVMNKKIAATPGSRKRFISEARSMAAVHHDNVATIFEVGEHNGTPYMAMELLRGATLENYRETHGAPDYRQIIAFAKDIARGLAAAHEKGIVHRDIKPANIWLDTNTNRIKILDFGLALAQTPVDQLSGRGSVVGTPGYLSPEQARSEPLDDRSDLYSAGVVLYELACGMLPLKSKTVAEQLIAILAHQPEPLRQRNDQIPQPLAELIHRLMAKEPRDRYANAKTLVAELDQVEVECEKKSEVAQAISQLQAGLEQAVKKKSGGGDSFIEDDTAAASMPNPFESVPDAMPSLPPAAVSASPSGMQPAAAVSAGPLADATLPAGPSRRPEPAADDNTRKLIWIAVAAAAAILLITIPLAVYYSSANAIARQQGQTATVLGVEAPPAASPAAESPPDSGGTPKSADASRPKNPAAAPQRPARREAAASKGQTEAGGVIKRQPVTQVTARRVEQMSGPGARWLISNKQNNGSFEQTAVKDDQSRIPGWTLQTAGPDAGWGVAADAPQPEAKTFAYAGKNSETLLTSDLLGHKARPGDIFRLAMVVGGEGSGASDYRVVVGFRDNPSDDKPVRYQIADLANGAAWNGVGRGRLRYEFTVPKDAAGKRPFVEVLVSNAKRKRNRAMVDRLVMTVLPAASLAATSPKSPSSPQPNAEKPKTKPKTKPKPKPDPAMVSVAKPAAEAPRPDAKVKQPAATAVSKESPAPARVVTLKTSDQGGADATVRRGGSSKDPLGDRLGLEIQTRNNAQIQHVYLRFPLRPLDGGKGNENPRNGRGGQADRGKRAVVRAQLKLEVAKFKSPGEINVRVYGLADAVSDIWPEQRIVWSNSLSEADLKGLQKLAEHSISGSEKHLTVESDALNEFVANASQRSVTFVLTGSTGNEWVEFASKEQSGRSPPTLTVGLSR